MRKVFLALTLVGVALSRPPSAQGYPNVHANQLDVDGRANLLGGAMVGNASENWILGGGEYGLALGRRALAVIGPAPTANAPTGGPGVLSLIAGVPQHTWWNLANVHGTLVISDGMLGGTFNGDSRYANNAIVFGKTFNPPHNYTNSVAMGIGVGSTFNHDGYLLSVAGRARAEEVLVQTGWWADFVFEDGYQLRTLPEVATYIDRNGRLPDMPSAAEVEANGVELGDMQARLLQKVEELTLYLIEQNAEIERLRGAVRDLQGAQREGPAGAPAPAPEARP